MAKKVANYEGVPLVGEPSGGIYVPENIPHFYDQNGVLKVVAVGYDSLGNIPAEDPAPENRAEEFHRAKPFVWNEPHAEYRSDGSLAKEGFLPGGQYVGPAVPEKELTQAEKDAKAFHDALAEPATLVPAALKQTAEGTFIEEVVSAVKKYIAS